MSMSKNNEQSENEIRTRPWTDEDKNNLKIFSQKSH